MPPPLSSSSASAIPQGTMHEPEKAPVRTKRRYGASCELCRRRKRKCPGRDSTGKSLFHLTNTDNAFAYGSFRNGKNMRVPKPLPTANESNNMEVNNLRKYIHRLATTNNEERDRLLAEWLKDDNVNQLVLSSTTGGLRHKSRDLGSVASEDDEGFDSPSTRMEDNDMERARPYKKMRKGEERRSRSPSADDSIDHDQDDTQWRPESALRLSLKPATPADSENSSIAEGESSRPTQPVSNWTGAKTHLLLAGALSRPSSIPTVQGILLLAANHAARGMYAQAWCLTASAIGMIIDLECHLDRGTPDEKPTDRAYVQRQMRLRVFWAAYNWDKMLSLALNRTPLLSLEDHYPELPDPTADDGAAWPPVPSYDPSQSLYQYQPQPCHEARSFYESCQANQFLDEIHRNLYRKKMRPHLVQQFIELMRGKLLEWHKKADKDVIRDFDKNSAAPPPHILQLNLLVQLIWILLYRPFYYPSSRDPSKAVPHAVAACEHAAVKIGDLFFLYDSHYPLGRASYLVIFAAFLAATVDLALVNRQKSVPAAILNRLELSRRVLEGGSDNIPGMQSSIASLQRHLLETMNRYNIHSDMQVDGSPTVTNSSTPSSIPTPIATKYESPTPPSTIRTSSQSSQSASPEAIPQPVPHSAHSFHPYPPQRVSHDRPREASNENHYPSTRPHPAHVDHYSASGSQPKHEPVYNPLPPQPEPEHPTSYQSYASADPQISLIPPVASYRSSRMVQEQQPQQVQQYPSSSGGDPYTQQPRRNSIMSDSSQQYTPISPQRTNAGDQGIHEYPMQMQTYEQPFNNAWFWDENYIQYQNQHGWHSNTT
ncbi:hypothetical protein PQX77_000682 [Marasmius sp. AFHP31]|nr:hypothetical protein PQX77_000682 [Marasmius sp. AFHP31]